MISSKLPEGVLYQRLPSNYLADEVYRHLPNDNDIIFLDRFMTKAFLKREMVLPSSWEGLIPFFYCLLDYLRPRRFVELGTYYGNSFFAACQVSRLLNNTIENIAVDVWQGDRLMGYYDDTVFNQFRKIIEFQYTSAKYHRAYFSEAALLFDNESIDLLHIDGLHSYEAVLEDYNTWLPKMSAQGIMLFHDTQVRDNGFGVYRLWEELSANYPSFELQHSHGLGVLLVGSDPPQHILRLFSFFSVKGNADLLRSIFLGLDEYTRLIHSEIIYSDYIFRSYTWRIGRVITYLPSKIWRWFPRIGRRNR